MVLDQTKLERNERELILSAPRVLRYRDRGCFLLGDLPDRRGRSVMVLRGLDRKYGVTG